MKKWFSVLGPGFITGASDDDPAGIGTYSQTGAQFGYTQSWTALFTFPLMTIVQEMCGRIGLVTGKGLASVLRLYYPKYILYFAVSLLFLANTFNIGANLGAMAASAQLVFDLPFIAWLFVFVIATLLLQVFVPYHTYAKYLKYLALSLFSYIMVAFSINIDWRAVLLSLVIPTFALSKEYLLNIVAIFGTTIAPYLFFWQADEEVEEEIEKNKISRMGFGHPKVRIYDLKKLRADTIAGMLFSNLIMFFIIVATGATLHQNGIFSINTASDAASALKPIAGDFASTLFALGIIGTGLLAVPVLAGSASYAVAETFGWREGLSLKLNKAKGFYGVIIFAVIIGAVLNFTGINPIFALYYSAVINGIIAPILIFIILFIANNKKIMGERVNSKTSNILGFATATLMSIFATALIFSSFS